VTAETVLLGVVSVPSHSIGSVVFGAGDRLVRRSCSGVGGRGFYAKLRRGALARRSNVYISRALRIPIDGAGLSSPSCWLSAMARTWPTRFRPRTCAPGAAGAAGDRDGTWRERRIIARMHTSGSAWHALKVETPTPRQHCVPFPLQLTPIPLFSIQINASATTVPVKHK
jgi:hypothetical protein